MGLRKTKWGMGDKGLNETLDFIKKSKDADVFIIIQDNSKEMNVKTFMHGNWMTLRELIRKHFEAIDNKTLLEEQTKQLFALLKYIKDKEQKNA